MERVTESKRLFLRELAALDLQAVHAFTGDEQVSRYQAWAPHSEEDARNWIALAIAERRQVPRRMYYWGIGLKESGTLIGGIGVDLISSDESGSAEIGYSLNRTYWQQGYGSEAVLAGIGHIFQHTSIRRLVAHCRDSNLPSVRLLEKLRFRREGHFVDDIKVRGKLMSSYRYAMLKKEFIDLKLS